MPDSLQHSFLPPVLIFGFLFRLDPRQGPELGKGYDKGEQEHQNADSCRRIDLVVLKGVPVQVVHHGHGRVVGAAVCQKLYDNKQLQHIDNLSHCQIEGCGLYQWDDQVDGSLELGGPVDLRRLKHLPWDPGQGGDVHDHAGAQAGNNGHNGDDPQNIPLISQKVHIPHAHVPHQVGDKAAGRIQKKAPDHGHNHRGHYNRQVITGPYKRYVGPAFVKYADGHGQADEQGHNGDNRRQKQGVPHAPQKHRVREQIHIILQPHKGVPHRVGLVQADAEPLKNRVDGEHRKHQKLRENKQISAQWLF